MENIKSWNDVVENVVENVVGNITRKRVPHDMVSVPHDMGGCRGEHRVFPHVLHDIPPIVPTTWGMSWNDVVGTFGFTDVL